MKRMKQIEQEKDVLLQGLTAVDKAREWYLKQISATQEKIKHLGRMGSHVVHKLLFISKNIKTSLTLVYLVISCLSASLSLQWTEVCSNSTVVYLLALW